MSSGLSNNEADISKGKWPRLCPLPILSLASAFPIIRLLTGCLPSSCVMVVLAIPVMRTGPSKLCSQQDGLKSFFDKIS